MRKSLFICLAAIACVALAQSTLDSTLSNQFRSSAPADFAAIGHFVHNIQNVAQAETITLTTSQIATFQSNTRTLTTYKGAHSFTPFSDLGNLRFGTSYTKLHTEHTVNIPGDCFSKVKGSSGTRAGTAITLRVGFGVSIGTGVPLYTTTKVKKCKKRLFRKQKCWFEDVQIPRGVTPVELQSVAQGLDNRVHMAISSAVLSSNGNPITTGYTVPPPAPSPIHHIAYRLKGHIHVPHRASHFVRAHAPHRVINRHVVPVHHFAKRRGRRLSTDNFNDIINHTVQELKGVPKASVVDAIHSMIGKKVDLDKAKLLFGKAIRKGAHLIQALRSESGYTVKIDSLF